MSNLSGLERMIADFEKMSAESERFLEDFLVDMALRVLAKTKKRTPVGIYDKPVHFFTRDGKEVSFVPETGKKGGTLRENWAISEVKRNGDSLSIEIYNPVSYAEYVEIGHVYPSHENAKGWWEGYHMCEISMNEVKQRMPEHLDKAWRQFCEKHLGG